MKQAQRRSARGWAERAARRERGLRSLGFRESQSGTQSVPHPAPDEVTAAPPVRSAVPPIGTAGLPAAADRFGFAARWPEDAARAPSPSLPDLGASASPMDDTEAYAVLCSLVEGKTLAIPESLVVGHVLEITRQAGWPVQRAAMEAVLRRCTSSADDALRVATRPRGGAALGTYTTRRAGQAPRPYTTLLESVNPLCGRCDCLDYLRNSLGLCKHLLAVIDALA